MDAQRPFDIAVIGAGIIGTTAALYLAERNLSVLLIDRSGIGEETSAGNAGAFAFTDILPLASPGIMVKAPKWFFDPTGPLSVPPAYLPTVAPWLWRFFRASVPSRYRKSTKAQAALMTLAACETGELLARTGLEASVSQRGALHLHDTKAAFEATKSGWALRAEHGIEHRHLDRSGIDDIQPGLSRHFRHATFVPHWSNVDDPKAYTQALGERAKEKGAHFERQDVKHLRHDEGGVRLELGNGRTIDARHVVIAAGAWSHHLARQIGDRIPLETERGYNTTLPRDAFDLKCQLVFDDHGFVVSPLACGVRVGGAVEMAGLDRPPDFRRSKAMLAKAKRFMPDLKTEGGTEWMGYRPSIPDTLPVIGRSSSARSVIHAFGHGHLGLTQSAATARLVSDLALDIEPAIDLAPYSPDRF